MKVKEVKYLSNYTISVSFDDGVTGIVTEWTALHQIELMENWERARNQDQLKDI